MMAIKVENTTGLLLCPQQLLKNISILQALHIRKAGADTSYESSDVDSREVNKYFQHLPTAGKETLLKFSVGYSDLREQHIRLKYKTGRAGMPFKEFYEPALLRELHGLFERMKPFTSLFKWYHKIWHTKSNAKTAPCVFSTYKPQLQFEVVKENGALLLKTQIHLNGTAFDISGFNRYHFLLSGGNEYFLLGFKDFQTLEWLRENKPEQYQYHPGELAHTILARLEEDYKVNRNGLFSQNRVDVLPVNRVILSEISSSFLVLTPQWLYEGFLVEGPWKESHEITKAGEAYLIQRNKDEEQKFTRLLEALHPNFVKQLNGYYYLSFGDAQKKQWFFKAYHLLLEKDIQVVGMDMLQHFRYSTDKAVTTLGIKENENNTLTVKLSLSFGKEEVGLSDLQKMVLAGQRAILLKNGSLGILGDEWIQQYGATIKHGRILNNEIIVAKGMALTEEKCSDETQVLKPAIKKEWWQRWQQWQLTDTISYPVPAGIAATLRPYQQKGYEWMVLLAEVGAGACLADDMGLGKTLQAICFIAHQLAINPLAKHLIICPSSLLYNWEQELKKFAPFLSTAIYHGPHRSFENMQAGEQQVVITTYGTMRADIDKIATIGFGVAVIDESHNIKNPSALITRAVNQINANTRIALSGTPVMNNTFDLYAQLSFLLPGMFGSREFFKREYADAIDRDHNEDKIKALQKLTAPFILRRTKEQVATDLPEKIESILWCEMGIDQQLVYESIKENVRNSIFLEIKEKGFNSGKLSVINGLLKLRQVCNSGELVKDQALFNYDSIKTDILVEELKNIIPNHKALVFSQFTGMLDLLEISFKKHQIAFCRLDGNTPIPKRQELVNTFQEDNTIEKVFLISLKAGNAGLNLTAADYVFLFDPWWNTAVQQQAIDRTHRIGQTKNVFAYKMICKNTIEEKIMQLQQRKKKLAEELIGEEEGFVKALNENDIEFLFS
ncbi:MAG: DEAD/DEAH box helicase [Ferruginibacter sp.]|nr:DEAD/DEAH box helicase [Ferruginibacter sp.]